MSTGSDADALHDALLQLSEATDAESGKAAYHQTFDAIGHSHSGSLRRSALPAVEDLLAIACDGRVWAADAAMDVLIDVTTSFDLDPELARDETDVQRFKQALLTAVGTRRREIGQLARSAAHERTRERASELSKVLDGNHDDPSF